MTKPDNAPASPAGRIDEATGTSTVGHEWDGIEELDNPMPRWWLIALYISIIWGVVYVILYPAWPMVNRATEGVLGWSSRGQLAQEMEREADRRGPILAAIAGTPIESLPENSELMRQAVAGGRAAFRVNCVQCHGAEAAGGAGYPNLNDDDWLWGGDLKSIERTIAYGVRQPGEDETHSSFMPGFGDGILTPAQIGQVADHVLSLSGKARGSAEGAQLFANNCAVCHGPSGQGDRAQGAPNLADAIWLYGGTKEAVVAQVANPQHGVMPAWRGRLDPVTIKMLAAYVHSLGGGEAFAEAAAPPAESDDQS
jgi:cytochrome c oxidase cbb3-type subunit 3